MKIPDICNVLSSSGKEFSLSHWYSPIIDSLVAKIEVQRKHLFQIIRIYWIDSLFNMQVFWDLWIQWSNCPYFVAKKDLHWIYLVEKGKSGYSCQDAKFRSTPRYWYSVFVFVSWCKSCPIGRVGSPRLALCLSPFPFAVTKSHKKYRIYILKTLSSSLSPSQYSSLVSTYSYIWSRGCNACACLWFAGNPYPAHISSAVPTDELHLLRGRALRW